MGGIFAVIALTLSPMPLSAADGEGIETTLRDYAEQPSAMQDASYILTRCAGVYMAIVVVLSDYEPDLAETALETLPNTWPLPNW